MSFTRQSFLTLTRSSSTVAGLRSLTNLIVALALSGAVSLTEMSEALMSQSCASTNGSKSRVPTSLRRAESFWFLDQERSQRRLEIAPDRTLAIERAPVAARMNVRRDIIAFDPLISLRVTGSQVIKS